MVKEAEIQFVFFKLISIVYILLAFWGNIGSNRLNFDALKVLGVKVVFLPEVSEVMVIGYHECVDLCKADIEARMMIDF